MLLEKVIAMENMKKTSTSFLLLRVWGLVQKHVLGLFIINLLILSLKYSPVLLCCCVTHLSETNKMLNIKHTGCKVNRIYKLNKQQEQIEFD